MQRKKLLALPIDKDRADVPQMQHIEETKKYSEWTGDYTVKNYNYCYDAFVDSSTGEDVLILDVFLPAPQAKFKYRLFMTGDKWFTVDGKGKTSERSLYWSVGGYWRSNKKYHPFNDKTDTVILDYIIKYDRYAVKYDVSCIEALAKWQDIIRERRLKNKYNKIKESISREMLEIRPLPKAFYDWIDNVVMAKSRYLFYDYNGKKQTTARCSVCGDEVVIPKVKKGDKVTCPHCKKVCNALPRKAFKNTLGFDDNATVFYLQPFKNGRFCARKFYVNWTYYINEQPNKHMHEEHRTIVDIKFNDLNIQSAYEYDPEYKGGEWRQDYTYSNMPTFGDIFPNTLNKIFKEREGFYKYHINFAKIARMCNPTDYTGIFNAANKVNFFDNLLNNKLVKLAKSFIIIFSSHGNSYRANNYNLSAGSLRNRPVEVAVQEPSAEDIEKAVAERTESLKAEFDAEKKILESESKQKLKKAKEKALEKAEKDKQKAVEDAKAAAKAEVEQKYKEQIESAEAEKAEALKKAEEIASKLDKNADADLVTASVYFTEAQKQLTSFKQLADKIESANNGKGAKLKKLAKDYLNNFIESLN